MGRCERGKGPDEDAWLYRIHNALFRRLTGRHEYQFHGTCAVSVSLLSCVSLSTNQGCLHSVPRAPNARAREDRGIAAGIALSGAGIKRAQTAAGALWPAPAGAR